MAFKSYETKIGGVRLVTGDRHADERGFFEEIYKATDFAVDNLPTEFMQENVSRSFAGVLRGLHIQKKNKQGKLVRCLFGTIVDVWADLRPDSPTFKKYEMISLTSEENEAIWIPPGIAHGFFCVSKVAVVHYKCTTLYDKESDGGVRWDDPDLKIEWPFPEELSPHVSPKDENLPSLREYLETLR